MSYKFKILVEKRETREVEIVAKDLDTAIQDACTAATFNAAKPIATSSHGATYRHCVPVTYKKL